MNLNTQIAKYQQKGYAHIASKKEIEEFDPKRVGVLSLGIVTNLRKPGKIRMDWDAAAKVNGILFNGMLQTDSDLLPPLPKVLYQFRQLQVEVVCTGRCTGRKPLCERLLGQ